MRKFFQNNIFTNPVGWANVIIGTNLRYRFMQVWTIFMGVLFFILLIITSNRRGVLFYAQIALFVIIVIEMPLSYLKAMRYMYLDKVNQSKTETKTNNPVTSR
jgi:hypothetical protein